MLTAVSFRLSLVKRGLVSSLLGLLLCPALARAAEPIPDPFAQAEVKKEPPKPKVPFEELLKDALPVTDLSTLVEPLYARCDDKDDLPKRQCEGMRAFLLDRLKARTFVLHSDVQPDTSPWDAVAKEIELEVSGCVICGQPPIVAGEQRYLTTKVPSRVVSGKAPGMSLGTYALPMETKVKADRFLERVMPRLRVQHLFKVDKPFEGTGASPLRGVLIVPIAHRVYDRCTGKVTVASNQSALVKVKPDGSCPKGGEEELSRAEIAQEAERQLLPERLTPRDIDTGLQPVQERIHDCYKEFEELAGTVKVQLTVVGAGKISEMTLSAPYDKAPIGVCIKAQIKSATFPKFRGEPLRFQYAFQVN